jgi:hypothetical protein
MSEVEILSHHQPPEVAPMIVSEARMAANSASSALSNGPSSPEGREISRRNGLKHGLTGRGIVVPEGDAEEIARRGADLTADMKPRSTAGSMLIGQMARLSLRAERAAERESAAIAMHVRHAVDAFDEERIERADQLFDGLGDDPRNNLRKLSKMPEGVERLIDGWRDLRNDLASDHKVHWTASHLVQGASMLGVKSEHARGTRLGALTRAYWGDFDALSDADGGDLDQKARRAWAKARLFERIDAEIAALEAHYETLDFETIELDRAEAGQRALFDPSKPACLARRYESEARRGFFKALKEFREVEAEFEARVESAPTPPEPSQPEPRMGSSRETAPPPDREPSRGDRQAPMAESSTVRVADDRPLVDKTPVKTPG